MELREQIVNEIKDFPDEYLEEIHDFIHFLRIKQIHRFNDTTLLSEKALNKEWLSPEEDEAWKDL